MAESDDVTDVAPQWDDDAPNKVALVAVFSSLIEYTQLRNQVVSVNLAVRDLQTLTMWWDSLSLVRRRTPEVTERIVSATEQAFLDIVVAHTTAASNTQISVEKALADEEEEAAMASKQQEG